MVDVLSVCVRKLNSAFNRGNRERSVYNCERRFVNPVHRIADRRVVGWQVYVCPH